MKTFGEPGESGDLAGGRALQSAGEMAGGILSEAGGSVGFM